MLRVVNVGHMTHFAVPGADYPGMAPSTLTDVFSRVLAAIVVVAAVFTMPAATAQETPGLAPAIGPWIGAPRGQITDIVSEGESLTIVGLARDPDSAQAISYDILVNGMSVASGATPRPSGFGRAAEFTEEVRVSSGLHTVCLRLADGRFDKRTVNCRTAVTSPPSRVAQSTIDNAKGVAITRSGVVVPILGGEPGNLRVQTPCGAEATLTDATIIDRARVVIDPGHGGSESGAVGGGLLEKNVNLVVSELVVEKFEDLGISAQLTRTGDYRVPIATRAQIATNLAPDVFLSLHHNGGATRPSSRPGTEIFYSEARPDSRRLAAILYEEMNAAAAQFDANWVSTVSEGASLRLREDGKDLYGVHRYSPELDSVITEFLYLSNSSEARLMSRPEVIEAEAQSIVDGILRWWFTDDTGTSRGRQFTDGSSTGTGGFDNCKDPTLNSGSAGLAVQREQVLAAAAGKIPAPAPPRSLLPALELTTDPSVAG